MRPPRKLTAAEFRDCFAPPMTNVLHGVGPVIDIWGYVDALDLNDLDLPSLNDVRYVYRDGLSRFDQVLIGTGRFNAFLVIVVDLSAGTVFGHHVLDLSQEFNVSGGHLRLVP